MMLAELQVPYFFDLSAYAHPQLFSTNSYVWEALAQLPSYLHAFSFTESKVDIPQGAFLVNKEQIFIGEGTVIEAGAYIKGPCVIGKGCTIRHGAYIRGNFICGDRCVIGHATEIKNSIFLNDVQAAHFAYLGDSILGNQVNLGAGTKCANLRLNHKEIAILIADQCIKTGRRKLGAVIGDRSQTGCQTVTNPGTLLGKNVRCYPSLNVGGFVHSNAIIKSKQRLEITFSASSIH